MGSWVKGAETVSLFQLFIHGPQAAYHSRRSGLRAAIVKGDSSEPSHVFAGRRVLSILFVVTIIFITDIFLQLCGNVVFAAAVFLEESGNVAA